MTRTIAAAIHDRPNLARIRQRHDQWTISSHPVVANVEPCILSAPVSTNAPSISIWDSSENSDDCRCQTLRRDSWKTSNVLESAADGTSVGSAVGTDANSDALQGWTITGGNAAGVFAINATTGLITMASSINLNYEATTSYNLTLTVSDDLTTSAPVIVVVNVTDVDEFDAGPISAADSSANSVAEASAIGTAVGVTAFATDADGSALVTYGLDDNAGGRFAINATTGVITTAAVLVGGSIVVGLDVREEGMTPENASDLFLLGIGTREYASHLYHSSLSRVKTPRDSAIFYTGRTGSVKSWNVAQDLAGNGGGTTIDIMQSKTTLTSPARSSNEFSSF